MREKDPGTHFVLHELDASLAEQLCRAVSKPGRAFHSTASVAECISVAEREHADLVFCCADPVEYRRLLNAVQRRGLPLPVVVVSRIPETSEWLDALDAGATDYCAAPFERTNISWVLQSALLSAQHDAAVAGR